MQETASAKASRRTAPASRASAPVEAAIVAAPKTTGIAAASGERKTSSSASSSRGRAMSSARWTAASEERVPSRVSSGRPVTVARTGAEVCLATSFSTASLRAAIWSWVPLTDSSSSARSPAGRSARAPGGGRPRAEHADARPLGEGGGERLALALDVGARAAQQDGHGGRVAEVAADHLPCVGGLGVVDLQPAGRQLAVDAQADDAEHGDDGDPRAQNGPRMCHGEAGERRHRPAITAGVRLHVCCPLEA